MTTPATALEAIDHAVSEALDATDRIRDEATVSYVSAVTFVHLLRFKMQEIRACVREVGPGDDASPGPLCSAALAAVRDELARIETLDGWAQTVGEMPAPPHVLAAMRRAAAAGGRDR